MTEAQPTFTQKPLSPQNVTEGENVTLIWTYNLDGTFQLAQLKKVATDGIQKVIVNKYQTNNPTITNDFKDRFHVLIISGTQTSVTITAIPRSDSGTYRYTISNNNFDLTTSEVEISVLCKYKNLEKNLKITASPSIMLIEFKLNVLGERFL